MAKDGKNFFYAKNLSDVFYQINSINSLKILGGCTGIKEFTENSMSVRKIAELLEIKKTERFFEFGAAVTLSKIEEFENSKLPAVFSEAVKSIAGKNIRNMATLGGNICAEDFYHTLIAPLLALDARVVLKSQTEENTVYLRNLTSLPKGWILSKVKIPIEEWDISVFRRLGPSHELNENSASFVFLATSQTDHLASLRVAFAGPVCFRSQELENKLIGAYLPLSEKNISEFVEEAAGYFDTLAEGKNINPVLRAQFLNLLEYSLEQLT